MRQRMISIGDDYWIEDGSGARAFKVDGKALRIRDTWELQDHDGRELATIREKKLTIRDKIRIELADGREATVKKNLIGFRDRFHINGCLLQFLSFTENETAKPFTPLMRDHVEQNSEQPCTTVCSGRESFKRLQRLKVRLLYCVFRLSAVAQYRSGGAIEIVEMRQGFCFELSSTVRNRAFRTATPEARSSCSPRAANLPTASTPPWSR